MPARTTTVGQAAVRRRAGRHGGVQHGDVRHRDVRHRGLRYRGVQRWVVPTVLVSLAAGLGSLVPEAQPAQAAAPGGTSVAAGGEHACAVVSGNAYCWGEGFSGELGDSGNSNVGAAVPVDTSGVLAGKTLVQIAAGYAHTCALDSAGAMYCWGLNLYGQLGDGSTTSSNVPVAVDTSGALAGKTITQITTGVTATCVLDSAGAAYCWGYNAYGQLGDGSTTSSNVPVAVDTSGVLAGKTLTQIDSGYERTCALDSAGAAFCWGRNTEGQLGDGSTTSSSVPVAVDTSGVLAGQTLTQISASWHHTCAVDAAGAAFCWGLNSEGQLGDGNITNSTVPVAVDASGVLAGKTVIQLTAGAHDTCALDAAGSAYCWGYDHYGELGNASTTDSSIPVAVDTGGVLAGKALTRITAGTWATCALDSAGAVYCWGRNASGELGDDSTLPSAVPVLVGL
jgi:alpha-tubulin suppressor-like RCC1 family protein